MPESISSKMRVLTGSLFSRIDFIASIILDTSPPEAILTSGLVLSPGLALRKNSILSYPFGPKSIPFSSKVIKFSALCFVVIFISKVDPAIFSCAISNSIFFESTLAFSTRLICSSSASF